MKSVITADHLVVPPEDERPHKTAAKDKLPIHEKALYGLGNPSMGMVNQIIEYPVQQVLVYGLGMFPVWKGVSNSKPAAALSICRRGRKHRLKSLSQPATKRMSYVLHPKPHPSGI